MYCIGLTGSIGSGKSTVATYFEKLGIDVINADHIAKSLVAHGKPALQQLVNHFGQSVLLANGELNRRYLRELIVKHADERLWLEALLHPLIRAQIQRDINQCKSPYCIIEIPLLTDKSNYPYLNRVLLIKASLESQIARIMARDHCSRTQACAILETTSAAQNKRQTLADDLLMNNGSVETLQKNVAALHEQYIMWVKNHP